MTETGTDDGFWRGLCFSERFDPPSCRPLLAAGGRCRSSGAAQAKASDGIKKWFDALRSGLPVRRYIAFFF